MGQSIQRYSERMKVILIFIFFLFVFESETRRRRPKPPRNPPRKSTPAPTSKPISKFNCESNSFICGIGGDVISDSIINALGTDDTENEAGWCIWNDWQSRDQRARIEGVYNHCRFS